MYAASTKPFRIEHEADPGAVFFLEGLLGEPNRREHSRRGAALQRRQTFVESASIGLIKQCAAAKLEGQEPGSHAYPQAGAAAAGNCA